MVFAARDVTNAEAVFGREGVAILQAPIALQKAKDPYKVQYIYSQLMHNNGFSDAQDLLARVKAWLHTFSYVRPDVAIFDHSPTALVAARALKGKKIISGSGFLVPPPGRPLPKMRYWEKSDGKELVKAEVGVVERINRVLAAMRAPQLQAMEDLFKADGQFLLGFKDLDHYPQRKEGNYLGIFPTANYGVAPKWPAGKGPKLFCYLHKFKTMPALFQAINKLGARALIYAPDVPDEAIKKFTSPRIVFSRQPLDLAKAGAECDAAITNGTYATTCAMLMAGKPVLMIPQNLERIMTARRVIAAGAGVGVQPNQPKVFQERLKTLLTNPRVREGARALAKRWQGMSQAQQTERMLAEIERLAPQGAPAAPAEAVAH